MYSITLAALGTVVECEEPTGEQRPPTQRTEEQVAKHRAVEQKRKADEAERAESKRQTIAKWKPRICEAINVGETLPDRVLRRKVEESPGQLCHRAGPACFDVWAHGGFVTAFNAMVDAGELKKVSGPPIDSKQDRWKRLEVASSSSD